MRSVTKAVIAGAAGLALLAGGAGSLAYWTDTKAGTSVVISSGSLSLGTIADGTGWKIQQSAAGVSPAQATAVDYTPGTTLVVPGDVLTKTVQVPVNISGLNNKATLHVTGAIPSADIPAGSMVATITSIDGVSGSGDVTLTSADNGTIPVVFTITIPWTDDNTTQSLSTSFQATYTLTQIPAATS